MIHDNRCNWKEYWRVPITGLVAAIGFAVATSPASARNVRQGGLSAGYLECQRIHARRERSSEEPDDPRWSLVGEFDGARGADCVGSDPKYRDLAGLGGVRFAWHPTVRFSPFWEVLAGDLHSAAGDYDTDYCCGLGR